MEPFAIKLIGFAAAACTTVAYAPQVIKVWKTRSTGDISLGMFLVMVLGLALWLAYGLLSIILGLGYAGVVLGLGQLLGRDSSLVVAAATLAVAALFQPARRRVQEAVDRRFNRRRYDGARTVAGFSARLREEIDLDTLTAELLAVVYQTVQPTQASLWLWQRGPPS